MLPSLGLGILETFTHVDVFPNLKRYHDVLPFVPGMLLTTFTEAVSIVC